MAELARPGDGAERARPGDGAERATPGGGAEPAGPGGAAEPGTRVGDFARERALRARIAELEALVDARTQAIVGMGARLAELQGDTPSVPAQRIAELERELGQLRATKVLRYSALPRRLYARLRSAGGR